MFQRKDGFLLLDTLYEFRFKYLSIIFDTKGLPGALAKLNLNFRKKLKTSNFCTKPSVGESDSPLFGFFYLNQNCFRINQKQTQQAKRKYVLGYYFLRGAVAENVKLLIVMIF